MQTKESLESLNSFRLARFAARINRSTTLLKMSDKDRKANLKAIESVLIMRTSDLKLFNADLLYSLVLAFTHSRLQSEILYLIEPHILAK